MPIDPFAAVRANTDRLYGRRKTKLEYDAEMAANAAGDRQQARRDMADLERYRAGNARDLQESQQRYGMDMEKTRQGGAERLEYMRTMGRPMPVAATASASPKAGPSLEVQRQRNTDWAAKRAAEVAGKAKADPNWKPSITAFGETSSMDDSGRVPTTPGMMRSGAMSVQRSQLEDAQGSNIRGMEYFQRMIGALRTPVESMNARDGTAQYQSPEESIRGVQLDAASGGMNREGGDVFRDQQVIARRDAAMLPQFRAQQEQTSALAQDTAAGRLSPENEAALAARMGDAGYQPRMATPAPAQAPLRVPDMSAARSMLDPSVAGSPDVVPVDWNALAAAPTPTAGTEPGRSWWDRQSQFLDQYRTPATSAPGANPLQGRFDERLQAAQAAQKAAMPAAPAQGTDQPAPGSRADMLGIQAATARQNLGMQRDAGQRAMAGGTEAIAGRVKAAIEDIGTKAKTTDEGIGGIGNALTLAQNESDVVDAQQAIYQSRVYMTAPAEVREYIDAMIYNARAAKAGMPLRPLPPKPQAAYYDLRDAPSNMGPQQWDTGMMVGG